MQRFKAPAAHEEIDYHEHDKHFKPSREALINFSFKEDLSETALFQELQSFYEDLFPNLDEESIIDISYQHIEDLKRRKRI